MNEVTLKPKKKYRFTDPNSGLVYEANKPTLGQIMSFERSNEEAKEQGKSSILAEATVKLLVDCGLPEDFIRGLEDDNLELVASTLVGSKKKESHP